MSTAFQVSKIAELSRLGWTENGQRTVNGPGRGRTRTVYVMTNSIGMNAFINADHVDYCADEAKRFDPLAAACEALA